ncbi:MAG TPA: hypothetical protein VIE44_02450 [Methylomirabilota bacterium]
MIGAGFRGDKREANRLNPRLTRHLRTLPANSTLTRVRRGTVPSRDGEGPFTVAFYERFLRRLPVRRLAPRQDGQPLDATASGHIRRVDRILMATAACLAVLGFLGYYLPVYRAPDLFPAVTVRVPLFGGALRLPWGELAWAVILTTVELFLLTLLNIVGVHEIAVATGFLTPETKRDRVPALLSIGLERKTTEVTRYGIDPFEGLHPWMLFLFNLVLRLKGWLANQAVRYLVRLLLGRYAVRALLDFAGVPLYMAINAYATHAVLREAKVVLMGPEAIRELVRRVSGRALSVADRALVYDTLQYIAVSKRDFHQNHYLLTKVLLELWRVPVEARHPLPGDYLERLQAAPPPARALCQALILSGFVLDGQLSRRELRRLDAMHRLGIIPDRAADVRRMVRRFLKGGGLPLDDLSRRSEPQ